MSVSGRHSVFAASLNAPLRDRKGKWVALKASASRTVWLLRGMDLPSKTPVTYLSHITELRNNFDMECVQRVLAPLPG